MAGENYFNRIEVAGVDPNALEKALAEFEGEVAPALERIKEAKSLAKEEDRAHLVNFMAAIALRNPWRREAISQMHDEHARRQLQAKEAWELSVAELKAAGVWNEAAGDNNVYSLPNNSNARQIWRVDAKTGDVTYIDLPPGIGGARRGHIDSQNRLWFSQFHANRYAMYDPKNNKVTAWQVPVAHAGAYDVGFDDVKYAWGADMSTDLVQRLNVEIGEWSAYLLPTSINTRHIDVQKSSDPNVLSSMWTEGQQTSKIVHIEPLTP